MSAAIAPAKDEAGRIEQIDWGRVAKDLDAQGSAVIEHLLAPGECRSLAELYPDDAGFRSRVVMARHGFGKGEYKYFDYPLPALIAGLRTGLYPPLVSVANRGTKQWESRCAIPRPTPRSLPAATTPDR